MDFKTASVSGCSCLRVGKQAVNERGSLARVLGVAFPHSDGEGQ